jgi:zinc/manganese transport system permease protein
MTAHLSWNLVDDVRQLFAFPFMVNALRAGTIVAVVAGAIGYVMVLRRQSFAGHTLALVGFPGAAGATWIGIDPSFGFYGFCVAGAMVIAALASAGRRGTGPGGYGQRGYGQQSAVIGIVQAFALACGMLFVSLYHGFQSGLTNLLFGTIIGVTDAQVRTLLIAGAAALVLLAVLGRPLLFATLDSEAARARGVPTGLLGAAFLLLLGVAAAGTSQITGSLLVFALLVAPAATAVRLTANPAVGLLVSVVVALVVTWLGEAVAYFSPYPIGFWVTTFAFAGFLLASGYRLVADRSRRARPATAVATAVATGSGVVG